MSEVYYSESETIKCMSGLNLEDGCIIYNGSCIVYHAQERYSYFIHLNLWMLQRKTVLLSDISQVSCDHSWECVHDTSYDEMKYAVTQLNNSKALWLDGLSAEFYHIIWNQIGRDFKSVQIYRTGVSPLSCQRVNGTLILKQGDNIIWWW